MSESYTWDDGDKGIDWEEDSKKYSWKDSEDKITPSKSYTWDDGDKGIDWEKKDKITPYKLAPEKEIADMFILTRKLLIDQNQEKIRVTRKAMIGLSPTDLLLQHFQERINNLSAYEDQIIADCEEVTESPTQETVNRIINR